MNIFNRINALPKGIKASFAFFIASLVTKGIAYITTPIFTRLLSTSEYGQASVFFTWMQILGIIAMFCLQAGVFNNGMIDYPDKRDDYSFSMLILSNIITIFFALLFISVYPWIQQWLGLNESFFVLMFIMFLFHPAYNFWLSRQRYEYKYKSVFFWSIVSSIVSPLTAVLLLVYTSYNHLYARIFGTEFSLLIIYIGFYIYLGRKNGWKVNTFYWKNAILFNLPLIPHYLSTFLLASADKLMISNIVNDSATAFYSVAYSVAAAAMIVWNAINGSLIPYTYEKCKAKDFQSINKVTLPILMFFGTCCIIVILLAPEVVTIMATQEYMEAIYVIPPIVGGVFFQVQYYIYANVVYYYKRPKYVMFGSVIATVLNILLNYYFIRVYGYIAAGYTTLLCYLVQAIIDYIAMKNIVGISIYNMPVICSISFVIIMISLFSNRLYNYVFIRYIILLLTFIIVVKNQNMILSVISKVRKK